MSALTPARPSSGAGPATLMVIGSCTSLQIGAALATRLFPATGAGGATLLRLGLAACVLLLVSRPGIRAWTRAQWRAVVLFGLSLAGMNAFFYAAIARIPLGVAVTIEFLGPLTLSAVLSRRLRDLAWVLLALAGVVALGWAGRGGGSGSGGSGGAGGGSAAGAGLDPVGVALVLVAAVFWAFYILAGSRAGAQVPGRGTLAVAMAVAALAITPDGMRGAERVADRPGLLLVAFGTALMASVVPYTLEFAAMRRIPRRAFGILLSLEPVVATLAGRLVLGQRAGLLALAAIATVVVASVGSTLSAAAVREGSGGTDDTDSAVRDDTGAA